MSADRYQHISDQELLEKFYSDRDNQWLGILLQRYTALLLGVCMKYLKNGEESKDAVQQIFLKAITELAKYRVQYLKSWLYMIARNHCLMQLRDKNIHIPVEESTQISENNTDPEALRNREIALNLLELALEELNPEQKTCVTLFYLQKRSYQDIAETTGYSLLQVKSYIQNGKRNLKILVERKLQNPQ